VIRFMLAVCVLIVAALLAPVAAAPGVNSADLIVCAAPIAFLALMWPRARRPRSPWIAAIPESHPDALGSLDRERIGPPPTP